MMSELEQCSSVLKADPAVVDRSKAVLLKNPQCRVGGALGVIVLDVRCREHHCRGGLLMRFDSGVECSR
jgi:hypothetical protein